MQLLDLHVFINCKQQMEINGKIICKDGIDYYLEKTNFQNINKKEQAIRMKHQVEIDTAIAS